MTQATFARAETGAAAARMQRPSNGGPLLPRLFTLERIVMGAAIAALFVLVVFPLVCRQRP